MTEKVKQAGGPTQIVEGWSRDGFLGERAGLVRSEYTPDYVSVSGLHAPRRMAIGAVQCADRSDPMAMPTVFATTKSGLSLSVSRRQSAMPYVLRNVEADEMHFIQEGEIAFRTDYGTIVGLPGDFVYIPRSVAYRITPGHGPTLTMIVESPGALRFDTPAPVGMIHFATAVKRAKADDSIHMDAPKTLILKSGEETTRFEKQHDSLSSARLLSEQSPVWKLSLADIHPVVYWPLGGPPSHFMASPGNELLFYTLSARPGGRPPIHVNADYDEMVFYFQGPDAWGNVSEPGTWTWVPKGVTHQGPPENAARGYLAWLLESRTTLRLTQAGMQASEAMETGMYGRQFGANPLG